MKEKRFSKLMLLVAGISIISFCGCLSHQESRNQVRYEWVEKYSFTLPPSTDELITISSSKWKIAYDIPSGTVELSILQKQNYSYYKKYNTWWDMIETVILYGTGERIYNSDSGFPPGDYRLLMNIKNGYGEVTVSEWEVIL